MNTQHMLDNAATASQSRDLVEPETRGAILRSVAQWLLQKRVDQPAHRELIEELAEELSDDAEYLL